MAKSSRTVLVGMALEMARIANEALARAGLGEATVVGEARRGVELVRELALLLPGRAPARDVARALERATACEGAWVEGRDVVRMRFEGGGPVRVVLVPRVALARGALRETGSPRHVRWLESRRSRAGGLRRACARARTEQRRVCRPRRPVRPARAARGADADACPSSWMPCAVSSTCTRPGATARRPSSEMARAAGDAGFAYVGITEHSQGGDLRRGARRATARAAVARHGAGPHARCPT